MPDLLLVTSQPIGQKSIPAVSARDLHHGLGVHRQFANWIQQHISRHEWVEGTDYGVFNADVKNPQGGRPTIDYALSIQMAEHIAMMTRTEKGRQIREWFRTKRDELTTMQHHPLPQTKGDLLVHFAEAYRDLERRTTQLEADSQAATTRALLAEATAAQAKVAADLALADTRHMSLEEFIVANHLLQQFPLPEWSALSKRLGDYCTLYNLPTYKTDVYGKPWPQETVYPLQALAWLVRYPTAKHPVLAFPKRARKE